MFQVAQAATERDAFNDNSQQLPGLHMCQILRALSIRLSVAVELMTPGRRRGVTSKERGAGSHRMCSSLLL